MGEEVVKEADQLREPSNFSTKLYDIGWNGFRFFNRGSIGFYTAKTILQNPADYSNMDEVFAAGAGVSLAFEVYRGVRDYLKKDDDEVDEAFDE